MDKAQALHRFWSGFGIPAYDENSVPDDASFPRITYSVATDSIGGSILLNASVWYKSTSWREISQKVEAIAHAIVNMYPPAIELDEGRLYLYKGTPFAQRMSDDDDTIRRIYLNVEAEYLTAD